MQKCQSFIHIFVSNTIPHFRRSHDLVVKISDDAVIPTLLILSLNPQILTYLISHNDDE